MRFVEFRSTKKQAIFELEFVEIRCGGEVLCVGRALWMLSRWGLNDYYEPLQVLMILSLKLQSCLFNMTRVGNEKTIVLSRSHVFSNMTNWTSLS